MQLYRRVVRFVPMAVFAFWVMPTTAVSRMMILDNPVRLPFSGFASAMAVAGDVDGDGAADYLIGAYDHPVNQNEHQGRAFVFSGNSGKLLCEIDNPSPIAYAAFGFSVSSAGDVNTDTVPDFLIGAFGQEGSGKAFVLSGKDRQLLYSLQAPQRQMGAGFGWAVASVGDLTGDGIPEQIVGAFAQDGEGRVFVFSGRDGKLVRTLAPPQPPSNGAFGWSVAEVGDLNKDGTPDIVVGAPYTNVGQVPVQGRVYVFSGREGQLLLTLDDPQPVAGEVFGWRAIGVGDLNKDSVPDILVGAPYKDVKQNPSQGMALAFSGADGKLLFALNDPAPKPYSGLGYSLAESPDVNLDGASELIVGAPFHSVDQFHIQGEVFIFNGRDGRLLTTFDDPHPHQGTTFGYSIVSPGDVNGDQIPEFAIGASGQAIMDKVAVGRVYVFLSQP